MLACSDAEPAEPRDSLATESTATESPYGPPDTATSASRTSPYTFSVTKALGGVELSIEDKLATRTRCPDPAAPPNSATLVECAPMIDIVVHREEFPTVDDDMDKTIQKAFYYAWRSQGIDRQTISFDEYLTRLAKRDNFDFKTWGFVDGSFLPGEIVVHASTKVSIDWLAEPAVLFKPFTSFGMAFRSIGGELHLELWNYLPPSGKYLESAQGNPTPNIFAALTYLSNFEMLKSGFGSQQQIEAMRPINEDLAAPFFRQLPDGSYSLAITSE